MEGAGEGAGGEEEEYLADKKPDGAALGCPPHKCTGPPRGGGRAPRKEISSTVFGARAQGPQTERHAVHSPKHFEARLTGSRDGGGRGLYLRVWAVKVCARAYMRSRCITQMSCAR